MPTRTRFGAPWCRELMAISAIGSLTISVPMVMAITRGGWLVGALLLTLLAIPVCLTVRGYELRQRELVIHRLFWDTRWPLHDTTVATVSPQIMANSWRTWGNGGFFSFSGHFVNTALSRYRAFVTDHARTVVLDTPKGMLVVSPDDPVAFSEAVAGVDESGASSRDGENTTATV
jgi:hypothetical protein